MTGRGRRRRSADLDARWRGAASGGSMTYVDRGRVIACFTLPAVTVLLVLAVHGQWWQLQYVSDSPASTAYQIQYAIITFEPGGSVTCTSWSNIQNFEPCQNVTAQQTGSREALYVGLQDSLVGAAVLGALASVVAVMGHFGIRLGRLQLTLEIVLALTLVLVTGGFLLATTVAGPGPQAGGYCWYLSGNLTTCPAFWGSSLAFPTYNGTCLPCDDHLIWGSGYAYYETAFAVVVDAATVWMLLARRSRPFTREEQYAWMANRRQLVPGPSAARPDGPPGSSSGPGATSSVYPPPGTTWTRPPVDATHPGFRIAEHAWTCPNCQLVNSRWAVICKACRSDRPPQ